MIRSFLVDADGSVSVRQEEPTPQKGPSKFPEIIEKMKARNWAEASRLVAIEIGSLVADIRECKTDAELQACDGKLKALCALSASIAKTEALMGRDGDALNLDGPKFQFLFAEIVKSFMKAAADALGKGNEVDLNKIKEQVDYQIKAAMPEFRRRLETIGLDTGTDASKGYAAKNRSERSE
jgi:hypothetical protein